MYAYYIYIYIYTYIYGYTDSSCLGYIGFQVIELVVSWQIENLADKLEPDKKRKPQQGSSRTPNLPTNIIPTKVA